MLKHIKSTQEWDEKSLSAKGFTLVELLVVIVILGVLAAVVVFSVSGITNNSDKSACKTQLRTIETAVEAYRAQEGGYPANTGALVPGYLKSTPDTKWGTAAVNSSTGAVTGITCP